MKLQNVLMKSLALGAVVVSLSPLASVAILVHADGIVKSELGDKVLTTKEVDYLGFHGGKQVTDYSDAGGKSTITINSNHLDGIKYEIATEENGRDIFTGFTKMERSPFSPMNAPVVAKIHQAELNVPGKIVCNDGNVDDGHPEVVMVNPSYNGKTVYEINLRDVDVTGKNEIVTTFYAKDTGLSADYTATFHIKRTF
ncbi:MAG: hypothetical protein LBT37_08820 [Lactobacillaceae bacterium]|jgi:hypothetical protein|nr:hypothetical protein [Lactobacillaceae bacterium]